jgi:hypothetical protein
MLLELVSLSANKRTLILQSVVLLSATHLSLKMFSLQRTAQILKRLTPSPLTRPGEKEEYRMQVGWAVEAVAKRMLNDRTCLTRALTAKQLLDAQNIPALLCIGVAKNQDGELLAHAWVESDDVIVIGGPIETLDGLVRMPPFELAAS